MLLTSRYAPLDWNCPMGYTPKYTQVCSYLQIRKETVMEDRPKKRKQRLAPGQQETISADQFFREITSPSYSKRPATIYLYLCPQCGWWDISNGVAEVF